MKKSFFKTREGEMSLAGLLCLIALPVIVIAVNSGSTAGIYTGLAMICLGMIFPIIRKYVFKPKEDLKKHSKC